MKTINIFLTGLIFATGFLLSTNNIQAQQELSLMDAIQTGLDNNFNIRISEQDLEIARNNNAWGTAGMWPSVAVGIGQRNRYDDVPAYPPETDRSKYYTNSVSPYISVNWNIFRGLSVHATKAQLELLEDLTEGNAAIIVENTIQGIILSYYNVLLEQEKLKILDDVKKLSGDRYDYVMHKKQLGSAVTYDVIQAENNFLQDSTNYLLGKLNLRNSFLSLKLLLGVAPETEYIVTGDFEAILYDLELDSLMNQMIASNTTIRNQYINQEILKKDISLAKGNVWPTLGVNAGFDQFNTRTKDVDDPATYSNNLDFYANFTLNFNLYNGGNTRRAIQNAKINDEIGNLEIAQMKLSLGNVLYNYYELYNIQKELYNVALLNKTGNELNVQISTDKYRSGAINSFNFRDVQLQYLNAAFNELNAVYNLIATHTDLLRITGSIISENR